MSRFSKRSINQSFVSAGMTNAAVPAVKAVQIVQEPMELNTSQNSVEENFVDENGKVQFKKIFKSRKKPSVRAKEQKERINRTMRKLVIPKNALMSLNEIKSIHVGDFQIEASDSGGYTATVQVNDKEYSGNGSSKIAAKNNASEKALRDIVITKMLKKPRFGPKANDAVEPMDASDDEDNEDDEMPMINLASYAIYKLFGEWENEGFNIPELHPSKGEGAESEAGDEQKATNLPKPRAQLPNNWQTMNPALLFSQMRPGLAFTELEMYGKLGVNQVYSVSVTIDDTEYMGYGRSKKLARRNCATNILNDLYNTNFVLVEPSQPPAE